MTCPMNCPKNLRNGPCGGVRLNGNCEVKPEMECVWVAAVRRAAKTPYAQEIYRLNPPVDWRLKSQASWVTFALGRDQITTGSDTKMRYATESLKRNGQVGRRQHDERTDPARPRAAEGDPDRSDRRAATWRRC